MAEPVPFPQSKATQRKGKPTIGQILDENLGCQPIEAVMRLVKELHPTAKLEEMRTALEQFVEAERIEYERVKAEIETMVLIEEVAGNAPPDEAQKILADWLGSASV